MDWSKYHFPQAPKLVTDVPGPQSQLLLQEQEDLEGAARSYPRNIPIAFDEGRGATLKDADGNVYLDFFAGAGTLNVGHNHPDVLEAAMAQQRRLIHALDFPTQARIRLMRKLREVLPGALRESAKLQFGGPTGSDAVESAIKLARIVTGRSGVIAFHGSYHGMTTGALGVSSTGRLRQHQSQVDVQFMPYAYCYRCPFGLQPETCGLACVNYLKQCLEDPHSGVNPPAAIIVEPIQGEGGSIVPPPAFLTEVERVARKHGSLLICDEVQTGFCRTGAMFASNHSGVTPDILCLSKALGGIGYPISCIAYDQRLDRWPPGQHIGTFRGHQVAMAAGAAAIEFMQESRLWDYAMNLGDYMLSVLRTFADRYEHIGDVRGKGLMIGVEFVKDRENREPWPQVASRVREQCYRNGLIVELGGHYANVIRFLPPLVLTRELADKGLEVFQSALAHALA